MKTHTKTDKHSDSKRKALIAAKIITEANDKVDTPIPALLLELQTLRTFKGVTGFDAKVKPDGSYKIVMYGSEHVITDDYTPTLKENKKVFRGDDHYDGENIGHGLDSPEANAAEIQSP